MAMDGQGSGTSRRDHPAGVDLATREVEEPPAPPRGDDHAATTRTPTRIVAATAAAFVVLTAVVWHWPITFGDRWTGAKLLTEPGSLSWRLAQVVSFCASGPVVAVVAIAIGAWTIVVRRRVIAGLAIVAAPAVAGVVETIMKSVVGRARPATMLLSGESGDGYPSGHVTGFTALVVVLLVLHVLRNGRMDRSQQVIWVALAVTWIVLVSWSRVAVGAHYATDTYGGILLGVTIGLLCPIAFGQLDELRRARR